MTDQNNQSFELPVMQILREAYGFVFSVPQRVIIAALVPFGIYFILSTLIQVVFLNASAVEFFQVAATFEEIDPNDEDLDLAIFADFFRAMFSFFGWTAVLAILAGIAGASMAAAWHRTTLIGLDADRTGFGFFFGRTELSYFFRALVMVLITVAALFGYSMVASLLFGVLSVVLAIPAGDPSAALGFTSIMLLVLLAIGGFLVWLFLWAKLIMCLPAAALGIQKFGFGEAWTATDGHTGRLMMVYAGLMIPISALGFAISWLLDTFLGTGGSDPMTLTEAQLNSTVFISVIPTFLITAFSTALIASGMSYTYYRLGQPPEWVEKVF